MWENSTWDGGRGNLLSILSDTHRNLGMPAEKEIQWGENQVPIMSSNPFSSLPDGFTLPFAYLLSRLIQVQFTPVSPTSSLDGLHSWLESLHRTSNSVHPLDFKIPVASTTGYTSHLNVPLGTLRILEIIVTIQILLALHFSTYLLYWNYIGSQRAKTRVQWALSVRVIGDVRAARTSYKPQ